VRVLSRGADGRPFRRRNHENGLDFGHRGQVPRMGSSPVEFSESETTEERYGFECRAAVSAANSRQSGIQ
jgi:hypothetical protein